FLANNPPKNARRWGMTVGDASRFSGGRQRILPESYPQCSPLFTNEGVSFRNGRASGPGGLQGNVFQTNSGLFVRAPLLSQYSENLNRFAWPSRKTKLAPWLCKFEGICLSQTHKVHPRFLNKMKKNIKLYA